MAVSAGIGFDVIDNGHKPANKAELM